METSVTTESVYRVIVAAGNKTWRPGDFELQP